MSLKKISVILGLTLLTMILWIGFELYRTQRTKLAAPVLQQIEPLDPTLDLSVFDTLKERRSYAGTRASSPSAPILPSPTPQATAQPIVPTPFASSSPSAGTLSAQPAP